MAQSSNTTVRLNLEGKFCPEVVLRVKSEIDTLPVGTTLEVLSTDPLSEIDIPLFAMKAGHQLKRIDAGEGQHRFALTVVGAQKASFGAGT